jgi:hypothetical protein
MHCGEDYTSGLQWSHDEVCLSKPARCPHDGCCVMLPRAALADHARGCMLRRVPCPLPGCGALVPVAALWQHLAWPEPRHVYLLAMQYCSLESSLGDATSRLAQAHLEHHAAALTPQHEQMESLRAQNAALRQRLAAYEPPADPEPPGSDEDDDAGDEWEPVGQDQGAVRAATGAAPPTAEEAAVDVLEASEEAAADDEPARVSAEAAPVQPHELVEAAVMPPALLLARIHAFSAIYNAALIQQQV